MNSTLRLRAGDWVQVRSKEEILVTLDKRGQLEGLPFMPEMFEFCGKRLRVFKRAHKTCDPPSGLLGRRMLNAVHLESVRCNGAAHGGCQARCLIFWKEAWLRKVDGQDSRVRELLGPSPGPSSESQPGCTENDVLAEAQAQKSGELVYVCQATHVAQATLPLPWWDLRQYVEDYQSGNVKPSQLVGAFAFFVYEQLVSSGIGLGSVLMWLYDTIQKVRGGSPYPVRIGKIPRGASTPSEKLDLQPGEWVKVRPYEEILATLNEDAHNRGMYFDAEMVQYCGGTHQVLDCIHNIIDEKTGKMRQLKNDCIMLDDVVCRACYAKHRRFCPRSIYPYWREIWLERVGETPSDPKPVKQS